MSSQERRPPGRLPIRLLAAGVIALALGLVRPLAPPGPAPDRQPAQAFFANPQVEGDAAPPKYSAPLGVKISPLTLTFSGGVSLGSYQSGLAYYSLRHLRNWGLLDLRVVTGTSAGSINGLISIAEACGEGSERPQDSLFWKSWIPFGIDQLVIPERITAGHFFSREGFERAIAEVESRWMRGFSPSCDVLFGVSVTRAEPSVEALRPGLQVSRLNEYFVVRVRGRGRGVPPLIENYADPTRPALLLALTGDPRRDFRKLSELVFASAAVPLAFPAQSLAFCRKPADSLELRCDPRRAEKADFVDGGMFDNAPVRLAHRLVRQRFGDSPERSRVIYGFVSVDHKAYPERPQPHPGRKRTPPAIGTFFDQLGHFIDTARDRELSAVFEDEPGIQNRVLTNARHLPLAGEHLTEFMGFFEEDFRRYDFYLGMFDARYTLKKGILEQGFKTVLTDRRPALPEELGKDRLAWSPVSCLSLALEALPPARRGPAEERCRVFTAAQDKPIRNYRALLQASLNLLYAHCQTGDEPDPTIQPLCHQIRREADAPPAVSAAFDPARWRPSEGETDYQYFLRTLGEHGFHFRDLGLAPGQGRQAARLIERRMLDILDRIAAEQPAGQGLALRILGSSALRNLTGRTPGLTQWMGVKTMQITFGLIFAAGLILMILERLFPARALPAVPGWWVRVVVINVLQAGVVIAGGLTWERWFHEWSLFKSTERLGELPSAFLGYFVVTFVYYWWHRWRHESQFLWNTLHQIHHSPSRIETITSFYKHPVEIFTNSLLISSVIYVVLGLSVEAGAWVTVLTCYAEFFYHMNLRTPRWAGWFIQRPEMHRFHHQRGRHFGNFADLPVWDMLFGTYFNPRDEETDCGFKPEREARFTDMLLFRDVNSPRRRPLETPRHAPAAPGGLRRAAPAEAAKKAKKEEEVG
jgi:sterol desaturase/sphingolipid hydroxylase (fatty acid hydroxylase superfamily)/predicted acylesterase/phospholipase RssA